MGDFNSKKRKSGNRFAAIPKHVLDSPEYAALRPIAVKLLVDLAGQYYGPNNGDFTVAWAFMKVRGWRSKGTLYRALGELERAGFVIRTRQGSKRRCSLFAISFLAINECGGKLDSGIRPTNVPPNSWKKPSRGGPALGPQWPRQQAITGVRH